MPSLISNHSIHVYRRASTLPFHVWVALLRDEHKFNIILPHALQTLSAESSDNVHLWMTCSTFDSVRPEPTLDFVLSCTQGAFGSYPLFIVPIAPFEDLTADYLRPRLEQLVSAVLREVPVERVFSVFAPDPVTYMFADLWSRYTGIGAYAEPYYAAKLSYCTPETFIDRKASVHPDLTYVPRLAVDADVAAAAALCKGFAATSEPFVLTDDQAWQEAKYLIRRQWLWVLEARYQGGAPELASIVAVTRQTDNVGGITKVFTNPRWRKRGCAERLVRLVCKQLLLTKRSLVLYCAHDNPAATGVYHRVGFAGLDSSKRRVGGVDPWLEIGFDRDIVRLGHW
ncbi:hypothetical protein EWM64_g2024 [Hericium alpestre]|uniref:N-acetyltransferase domain-containing protein n=1 Tax=Hericium alpestre TaxID=135208 RepID=A0A4Z0A4M9_9AGAM|nr:hypothetical protein EWM64_g2024 [Hericium alpestre]